MAIFIYRETINAPGCDAIHISEIETSIECDTFMPAIDYSVFQPWYSSFPVVENNIRYSFTTYVRVRSSAVESLSQNGDLNFDSGSETGKFEVEKFSFLPKTIFESHEEYMYLRLVQEIISDGNPKDDRTGTGTWSKFGSQVWSPIIKLYLFCFYSTLSCLHIDAICCMLSLLYFHRCGSICAELSHFLLPRHVYLSCSAKKKSLSYLCGLLYVFPCLCPAILNWWLCYFIKKGISLIHLDI